MKSEKLYHIILLTFFGMIGSILTGFIFFNKSIFIPSGTTFQFVMSGLYGALFFSLLEYKSVRDQILVMAIILILNLVIFSGKLLSIAYLIRDIFFLGSLFLSIKLYYQFIKRNPKLTFYLRSFVLVLFYGLLNTMFGIIVFIISAKAGFPPLAFIYTIARYGILIGLGIGLGIDFYLHNKKLIFNLLKIKTA
ncbi:hypothetical protein ES705_14203 [subsurface metagenome]